MSKTDEDIALAFVDSLVPNRFDRASAMIHPKCEYHYRGEILRGDAIVEAFEDSHRRAAEKFTRIDAASNATCALSCGPDPLHSWDCCTPPGVP